MELGEKIRLARLEAGLSQRQLCGDEITRNMLSQIEHGTAKPSMSTLRYLASRLGKSVSYFLEEDAIVSPNQGVMESARRSFDAGLYAAALVELERFQKPDPVFDRERQLTEVLCRLALAEEALEQGKAHYARELLEKTEVPEYLPELERRRLLLLGRIQPPREICGMLPSLDEELLLRARGALEDGSPERAGKLLDAAEDQENPRWCLLRGEAFLGLRQFAEAAACFHKAEASHPKECAVFLEACYRELEDYKKAYYYACKQKE